jgi:hypothetical protein
MSSQVASTEVDEYRASIARRCDAIHASGSHGLESDNDTAHVHIYYGRLPHEEEEPERSSEQHDTHNEWNSPIAAAAYNSVRNAVGALPCLPSSILIVDLPNLVPGSRDTEHVGQCRRAAHGATHEGPFAAASG